MVKFRKGECLWLQKDQHEGLVISYYMAYLLKCKLLKLPEVRKKKKKKKKSIGKYITITNNVEKYLYHQLGNL